MTPKLLMFTLAATILAAVIAAMAADVPAPAPATQPALPGGDIDLRSACAVAGSVVVGEADQVDPERYMQAFDGKYAGGRVASAKWLKGRAGEPPRVYLPVPSDKRPDTQLPHKETRYVFFLWSDGLGDPRAIKIVPETPEVVRQVEGLLADQARAHPASQPAAAGAGKPAVDLAASIVLAAGRPAAAGPLPATLRLTNRGLLPVRVCTKGGEWSSAGGRVTQVVFTPGRYKSDAPPAYEFARHVVELAPGASADVPVRFEVRGMAAAGRLTASYEVDAAVGAMLDVWSGTAAADPVDWPPRP